MNNKTNSKNNVLEKKLSLLFIGDLNLRWISDLKAVLEMDSFDVELYKTNYKEHKERQYDLILLCEGSRVCDLDKIRRLKKLQSPIIAATDNQDWRFFKDCFKAGVADCISMSHEKFQNRRLLADFLKVC